MTQILQEVSVGVKRIGMVQSNVFVDMNDDQGLTFAQIADEAERMFGQA